MQKFIILLKKEVRELLTLQLILPLIITIIVFAGIGKVLTKEANKNNQPQPITVLDQDQSTISSNIVHTLEQANFAVNRNTTDTAEHLIQESKDSKTVAVLVIPQGYAASVESGSPLTIRSYTMIRSFSISGFRTTAVLKAALQAVNEYLSNQLISQRIYQGSTDKQVVSQTEATQLKNPLRTEDILVVNDRQAPGSLAEVINVLTQQTYFIPIILFLVIILAAQMIATSMASEKENKTLETLLSLPISRRSIVVAKLAGAGIVSLLFAGAYMLGMRMYMNGITQTGLSSSTLTSDSTAKTIEALGLQFSPLSYVLLGLSLFIGILAALAIAMILGAFCEDVKSVQGVISPLMVLVLIPYLLTMLLDFNSLSPALRYAVMAIPFSHPFLAPQYLLLHDYSPVWAGILYQFVVVCIFVLIAARIFSSDLILTLKFNPKSSPFKLKKKKAA